VSINQQITAALSGMVAGNIWPLEKPANEDPDEFIVYNPEAEYLDYGDNADLDADMSYQVHWFKRGHANYLSARSMIRRKLREAGFLIEPSAYAAYERDQSGSSTQVGTGWTHVVISCRAEDE